MFWIIVIIIILAIVITSSNSKKDLKKTNSYPYVPPVKSNTQSQAQWKYTGTKPGSRDNSIIDVTGNSYTIQNENINLSKSEYGVPTWSHQYVYSYSEINGVSSEQKTFYDFFKSRFLNGIYLDVEGNSNYYFILLFDLLDDFDRHKDLNKLETQLNTLAKYYPKTKPYTRSFIIRKLELIGDKDGLERVNVQENSSINYYSGDYTVEYRLGKQYKDKLNLSSQEVSWLNKFWNPSNVFLGIEGCCIETIKLYLTTLKELNKQLKKKETTIAKEVEFFKTETQKYHNSNNNPYWGYDTSYLKEKAETEVYLTIFKRAENTVRQSFGHKRKIASEFPYSDQPLIQEFENRLGFYVNQILQTYSISIEKPDEKTEIVLNAQNVNRWKIKFEQLEKSISDTNQIEFVNGIYALEKSNQKNPAIENIFFEASKVVAKYDKVESLKFYIYYLYYDLKSIKFDNKQLAKTIQKNLFKTNDQLHDFQIVVADLLNNKDLNKALEEVSKIYQPKRKKIKIDETVIKEVQLQDKEAVELLNEYLDDEYEDDYTNVKSSQINNEEIKLEITAKTSDSKPSPFIKEIFLNEDQLVTLTMFAEKSFSIPSIDIDNFCKTKGVFKNQLIDSINESCYEVLDDVLIEEDNDMYTLNEIYYKKIMIL
jgi:TerB-C domain